MKKILLLFLLPILFSFSQENKLKDGKYLNNDDIYLIYGIEISNQGSEIKFFFKEKENDKTIDWKVFKSAKITTIKNKFFIENIQGYNPYNKSKLELKLKDGILEFNSSKLLETFYSSYVIYSNKLKFEPLSENKN